MASLYKLKGVTKLDVAPYDKQEVELEGLEDGKVLLVNDGSGIHALGHACTHFGAPLKNGVVHDGRITCPWHGACFKVSTGDVEDAPALDPIAKFKIVEKSDGIYIEGDEQTIKNKRAKAKTACKVQSQAQDSVVVVGGGSGSIGVLQALREQGFQGPITLIHKEPYNPIDRTKLSKALIDDPSKVELRGSAWFEEASIKSVQDEVEAIDFKNKTVKTKGNGQVSYTKLVLATGGTAKRLPIDGFKGDLENVFTLRTLEDTKAINAAVEASKSKNVVVIGSSFIGMEVANALAKNNVSIVGMENWPLERVMGERVGKVAKKLIEKNGPKFYMGASVDKATPSESDPKKVGAVLLKDGTKLPADVVILGVGVAPATEFLKNNSDIQLEKDGSIATNELFEVKNHSGVYAIGDIATYPYHGPGGNGTPVRIEHWNVAQNAGRNVGFHIAKSGKETPPPFIPVFWSALGTQLRYCGNTVGGFDDVVIDGNEEEAKFAAYYTKGNDVVAVLTIQKDPVMVKCAELMRKGEMLSAKDIKAGRDPLQARL